MSPAKIRTRFAPSPTGMFHVGNARSALFNWVVAKQAGGVMVLRIEDTDAERSRPEWTEGILDAMAWLGMGAEEYEGPYFQSANAGHHKEAIEKLFTAGQAYFCECTRDQVTARTGDPHKGYDGFCRDRNLGPVDPGEGRAVRFRTPNEGVTKILDLVRGEPTFENASASPRSPQSTEAPRQSRDVRPSRADPQGRPHKTLAAPHKGAPDSRRWFSFYSFLLIAI